MLRFLGLCLSAAVTLSLVGCGKSEDEKRQERVEDALAAHQAVVLELNANQPNESWSEAQLNAQLAQLSRLENLESAIRTMESRGELIVYSGGDNSAFIAKRRALIAEIKASRSSTNQKASNAVVQGEIRKRWKGINDKLGLVQRLTKDTDIRQLNSKTLAKMEKTKILFAELIQDIISLETYVDQNSSAVGEYYNGIKEALTDAKRRIQDANAELAIVLEDFKKLLAEEPSGQGI